MSVAKGNVVCYHGGLSFQKRIEIEMNFYNIWVFPKNWGKTTQNGWLMMEKSIRMNDLGVPLFLETPISKNGQ